MVPSLSTVQVRRGFVIHKTHDSLGLLASFMFNGGYNSHLGQKNNHLLFMAEYSETNVLDLRHPFNYVSDPLHHSYTSIACRTYKYVYYLRKDKMLKHRIYPFQKFVEREGS